MEEGLISTFPKQPLEGVTLRTRVLCIPHLLCLAVFVGTTALGQSSVSVTGSADTSQHQLQTTDTWDRVKGLAPSIHLRVSAKKNGGECVLHSVTDDALICVHGSATREVHRSDIRSVKLARRGRSSAVGLAIGAAAGAGLGAGIGSAINSADTGSLLHVSGGKSAGVGAAIGIIVGSAAGAVMGYSTDIFSGPLVYKR